MDRVHDHRSTDWDRYRNDSPSRDRDRDMYERYESQPVRDVDHTSRSEYNDKPREPLSHDRDWRDREPRDNSRSPLRDDYRDLPRDDRYDDTRHRSRSPISTGRHRSIPRDDVDTWMLDATKVVMLSRIPENVSENDIRVELQHFGAPIYGIEVDSETGSKGAREWVCFVEFIELRDAARWMRQEKGNVVVKNIEIPMRYSERRLQNARREDRRDEGRRSSERYRRDDDRRGRHDSDRDDRRSDRGDRYRDSKWSSRDDRDDRKFVDRGDRQKDRERQNERKTDTMIVMGLDKATPVETIRAAFEYITHYKIVDIRLVKDKLGYSRGFCFIQWEAIDQCAQVLEYLKTATPRFNIEGRQVTMHFSQPRQPEPQASSVSANAAAAAIEAAKWSKIGVGAVPASTPEKKAETAMAQVAKAMQQEQKPIVAANNGKWNAGTMKAFPTHPMNNMYAAASPQRPQRYPTPDISTYRYDENSGYYYDQSTGLYYNAVTRYYYNSFSGIYLYWDQQTHTYIPVSSEMQAAQTMAANEKKDDNTNSKEKSKTAKQIAKDMERWAKAQNKKKEEIKRLMEENTNTNKKESATVDAGFSMLEKKANENERRAALKDAFADDMFKKPTLPRVANSLGEVMSPLVMANHSSTAIPGLSSYAEGSDSEEEEEPQAPQLTLEEQLEKLTDLNKMTCLLCRRAFASKDALERHQNKSDLHKQNVEALRQKCKPAPQMGQADSEQPKYRDRAAERRSKYGIADPPMKKGRYSATPVPYEQPTKDGIGDTNIGNKMLQKMGWKSGSGLGKSQSGITVPIVAEQRTQGAGLGMRGSRLTPGSGDDYRENLKKRTWARYRDAD